MGNRRLGRKRVEAALKRLNATTADSTGSRAGNGGFHMPAWQLQPAKYFGFFDDFLVANGNLGLAADSDMAQASAINQGVWRSNEDSASSTSIDLDNSYSGGVIEILTGTQDDDTTWIVAINSGFALDATSSRKAWGEVRIQTSDADTSGFFCGLASNGGAEVTDAGGDDFTDAIGAYLVDGAASTDLTILSAVGGTETATSLATTVADDTWVTLSWYWSGTALFAYVNGELKATTSANIPNDGTILFPVFSASSRASAADTVRCDYMNFCQER